MQIWIWNDFRFPKIVKWLVFEHVCRFVRRVFWRSSEDSLECSSNIFGVLGVYGAKHSPSSSCFGGPSGWFWGLSGKHDNHFRKPLIFWIWASHVSWDAGVCLRFVLEWCKYEFGISFGSGNYSDDSRNEMSRSSSRRYSGGLSQVLWSFWEKSEMS